jgi:hypothetical protein
MMVRLVLSVLLVTACGSVSRPFDDAGVPASEGGIDAAPLPPTPSRELVNGAGRLKGATFTLDVEVGHAFGQQKATGPTYRIEGNTAVKP